LRSFVDRNWLNPLEKVFIASFECCLRVKLSSCHWSVLRLEWLFDIVFSILLNNSLSKLISVITIKSLVNTVCCLNNLTIIIVERFFFKWVLQSTQSNVTLILFLFVFHLHLNCFYFFELNFIISRLLNKHRWLSVKLVFILTCNPFNK
jgi:hypothetical protein